MGLDRLAGYTTKQVDINYVIRAVTQHAQHLTSKNIIPADPQLRINCPLYVVIDTQGKILLLPPGLPEKAYHSTEPVVDNKNWHMIKAAFTQKEEEKWLGKNKQGQYKLGNYSAWDKGLEIEEGAPEWAMVRNSIAAMFIRNPMQVKSDPNRSHIIPSAVFSAPTYRYFKKKRSGFDIPIFPELIAAMAHEGGSHLSIMGKVQSWPDGHGNDNSLIQGYDSLGKLIREYKLTVPWEIEGIFASLIAKDIAPIGHVHELLAYLTEIVETGIKLNQAYLNATKTLLSEWNTFGSVFAAAIVEQVGIENAAKFGNALIDHMVRD